MEEVPDFGGGVRRRERSLDALASRRCEAQLQAHSAHKSATKFYVIHKSAMEKNVKRCCKES